jgi:16S rRNA (guanine527-N7)-methyltransferase
VLHDGASRITGRHLPAKGCVQLSKYLKLLAEWNKVHRLVGSSDPLFIVERLILDSLLFLRVLPRLEGSVVDIGSGAGLPGIPLKIVVPSIEMTMLESRRRRASFLSTAIRELALENVRLVHARAEEAVEQLAGSFDTAVMRSVGRLDRVVPVAARFVKPGGVVVVSGPPNPQATDLGRWTRVEGVKAGSSRQFLIHQPGPGCTSSV